MSPINPATLLRQLRWRYATKKFDPSRKIPPENWRALEEVMVLSPSSYGLQPWKFIVVNDPATREQLVPVSWGQRQVAEASHLVVIAIKKHLTAADVDAHIQRAATVRGVPAGSLASYRTLMIRDLIEGPRSLTVNFWAANQAYIALGNLLTSAALLGIDTCPLEGFEPPQYDQILGLAPRGLAATVACALGYRAADDKYATASKVRFAAHEVLEHI
ncbi:MAG: NAD(P)H-dependent oxidoreductase [Verrucomicrobiota bacterium]